MSKTSHQALISILIVPVRIYQYAISPFTPASCRHVPSCSEYSVQALRMHGPGRGGWMAMKRIGRCHPWGTSGFDPVPKVYVQKLKTKKYMPKNSKPVYFDLLKGKLVLLLLAFSLIFSSCQTGQSEKSATAKPKVLVSILPYKYFVNQIAGDALELMVLIPPGTAPHVYDPSPRQMAAMTDVDVYFYNGYLSFEQSLIGKINDNYPTMELVNLSTGIEMLGDAECTDHSHDHHHASDPHTWLSAINGKIIAKNLYDFLVEKYPGKREIFSMNYSKLISKIDSLHQAIQNALLDAPSTKFMIFHPSLSYFARDYSLEQIPIEFEGKEPSPAKLKASLDLARQENIRTILIQKEFDKNNARIIAEAIGGRIVVIDPLAENWDSNLLDIAKKIAQSKISDR